VNYIAEDYGLASNIVGILPVRHVGKWGDPRRNLSTMFFLREREAGSVIGRRP